jgi:UDP-3-O-[3-hydroxymyristoyl] glucosamine N-acyltransferase
VTRFTAQQIVEQFGGQLHGNPQQSFSKLASLESADSDSLSFFSDSKRKGLLNASQAAILVLALPFVPAVPSGMTLIVTQNPYLYFAQLTRLFAPTFAAASIHPSAIIDPSAKLGKQVSIGPNVVVGANSSIGDGCVVDANCVVGSGVSLGSNVVLFPNVTLYSGVQVGARTRVHSGTVIGSDGFGYAPDSSKEWIKIEQLGSVDIGSDVEIGANCTIDRGAMNNTIIGNGCKLDNQIQVAHNVRIGARTAIAACVGIAGSASIGADCLIGGAAGILGHLNICDGVTVSAMSLVTKSISTPGMYTGVFPLQTNADWERSAVLVKQLDSLRQRIRALESNSQSSVSLEKNNL